MAAPITLRSPVAPDSTSSTAFTPPSTRWLAGTWHVTHSTLPMWKSKKNVKITYTLLPHSSGSTDSEETDRIDDLVEYQGLGGGKVSKILGIDKAAAPGAWDWRGKGWLMMLSSHWQILGFGDGMDGEQWVVTYFAKTLFTPAGIDIYSRSASGLTAETLEEIRKALVGIEEPFFKKLVKEMFDVKQDGG